MAALPPGGRQMRKEAAQRNRKLAAEAIMDRYTVELALDGNRESAWERVRKNKLMHRVTSFPNIEESEYDAAMALVKRAIEEVASSGLKTKTPMLRAALAKYV